MTAREPYDHERVVRQREIHDQPTQQIPQTPVERSHGDAYVEPPEYGADVVREDIELDRVVARRAMLQRISSIIWFVAGLLLAAIGIRIAFRLLNANEANGFVSFIYGLTDPFVRPFEGIFVDPAGNGAVLDTGALIAILVYLLLTWAIVRLVWLVLDRPETGVSRSVRHRHHEHL